MVLVMMRVFVDVGVGVVVGGGGGGVGVDAVGDVCVSAFSEPIGSAGSASAARRDVQGSELRRWQAC